MPDLFDTPTLLQWLEREKALVDFSIYPRFVDPFITQKGNKVINE